jgi:hypothetical protein
MGWFPSLHWEKDADGYDVVERDPVLRTTLSSKPGGKWIVGRGGKRKPFEVEGVKATPAFVALANLIRPGTHGEGDALVFAEAFGLPTVGPGINELPLSQFWRLAQDIYPRVWRLQKGGRPTIDIQLSMMARPLVSLTRTGDLILKVETFGDFVWLQIASAVEKKIAVKCCPACGAFMIPKSAKRQWCSEACRQRGHRAKMGHGRATSAETASHDQ